MDDYDKTCLESALLGVCNIVQQEWGAAIPCQVRLIPPFLGSSVQLVFPVSCRWKWECNLETLNTLRHAGATGRQRMSILDVSGIWTEGDLY